MDDPGLLRETSDSALERALLNVGTAYRCPPQTRTKTLAAVGLGASATMLAGSAKAAVWASLAKAGGAKLIVAVSLLSAVGIVPVGYYMWRSHRAITVPVSHGATAQPSALSPDAPPVALESASPAAAIAGAAAVRPPVRARPRASDARLARELGVLDGARTALVDGNANRAVSLLAAYRRAYPHGLLALEAEVLRIDALTASGRGGVARERAQAFLRRHPSGVFAARVREHLDD